MNNNNSLALSVLESIDNIDAACMEATTSVNNAISDLYIKEMDIVSLAMVKNKPIQEGWEWFNYNPKESILKTIFLFIPRMIIAIFRNIKNAFDKGYEDAKKAELAYAKELAQAKIDEDTAFVQSIKDRYEKCTNVKCSTDDAGNDILLYMSRIKDFEELTATITTMATACKKYRDVAKDIDIVSFCKGEKKLPSELFTIFHTQFYKEAVTSAICEKDKREPHNLLKYADDFEKLVAIAKEAKSIVIKTMQDVQDVYDNMIREGITNDDGGNYSTLAEKMMKEFKALNDDLNDVLITWSLEQTEAERMFKEVDKAADDVDHIRAEHTKKQLFDEKTKEARELADKWGVDLDGE